MPPPAAPTLASLADADAIDRAVARTVRGKRRRPDVAWFLFERDRHVARIAARLAAGTWRPGPFRALYVRDPKPRVIARTSVADRVVHTAIVTAIGPTFLRSASEIDFACREGMGTHRAILALLGGMQRHRFALHLDVRAYFPSIDVDRLLGLVAAKVSDPGLLALVRQVLDAGRGFYASPGVRRYARLGSDWPPPGRGLPMGSVVSQLLAAHVYLQALDHRVKRVLKVPVAVRYVDDLFLFGDRCADLRAWREDLVEYAWRERGLRWKHPNARLLACAAHLDGLGVRIRRDGIEPLPRVWRRMRQRLRAYVREGAMSAGELERSLRSAAATSARF